MVYHMALASVTSIYSQLKYHLKKTSRNFYFITLTCNKHPQIKTVDTEVYQQMLHDFGGRILNYTYELNQCGQLHLHALVFTQKAVFMKEQIQKWRSKYPEYHGRIDKVSDDDVFFVSAYINKNKKDNVRELYYRVAKFYNQPICEDFSDLADYGFEFNSKTGRFRYIKYDKVHFID